MSGTASPAAGQVRADGPAGAFTSVLNAAVGSAASKLEQRVSAWTDKLNDIAGSGSGGLARLADEGLDDLAEGGGAQQSAGAAGAKASLHGKNPFWAAVKGAWHGGSSVVKAAIVAALVATILLLVLSPVLLLVFLLALLVIAAVQRARGSKS